MSPIGTEAFGELVSRKMVNNIYQKVDWESEFNFLFYSWLSKKTHMWSNANNSLKCFNGDSYFFVLTIIVLIVFLVNDFKLHCQYIKNELTVHSPNIFSYLPQWKFENEKWNCTLLVVMLKTNFQDNNFDSKA